MILVCEIRGPTRHHATIRLATTPFGAERALALRESLRVVAGQPDLDWRQCIGTSWEPVDCEILLLHPSDETGCRVLAAKALDSPAGVRIVFARAAPTTAWFLNACSRCLEAGSTILVPASGPRAGAVAAQAVLALVGALTRRGLVAFDFADLKDLFGGGAPAIGYVDSHALDPHDLPALRVQVRAIPGAGARSTFANLLCWANSEGLTLDLLGTILQPLAEGLTDEDHLKYQCLPLGVETGTTDNKRSPWMFTQMTARRLAPDEHGLGLLRELLNGELASELRRA